MNIVKKINCYIVVMLSICIFCISAPIVSFAQSQDNFVPEPKATFRIIGDNGKEIQKFQLSNEEITTATTRNSEGDYTTVANFTIDSEMFNQLFGSPGSTTSGGDIVLTAGMHYRVSGNLVSMTSVFGSYQPTGYFYATDRRVDWANTQGTCRGQAFPDSNNWSYGTNSTYIDYSTSLAPYVRSECRINVSGMGGTGGNSVQFNLSL